VKGASSHASGSVCCGRLSRYERQPPAARTCWT
jgi:hypothetical protein